MLQHYVAQFILRNFSDDDAHIWTYEDKQGERKEKIEKVFAQRHITSYKTVDRSNRSSRSSNAKTFEQSIKKDTEVYEKEAIGKLEARAAPIIRRVILRAHHGQHPELSGAQSMLLKQFLFLSARRTPESQARIRSTDDPDLAFKVLRQKALHEGVPFSDRDEMYRRIPSIKRMNDIVMENADATFAAGVAPNVKSEAERFCREAGIGVLYCGHIHRRFIIGSFGYAIVTRQSGERYTRVAVFPMSPEVAIFPIDRPQEEMLIPIEPRYVHQINISSAECSHKIVGKTQEHMLQYQRHVRTAAPTPTGP